MEWLLRNKRFLLIVVIVITIAACNESAKKDSKITETDSTAVCIKPEKNVNPNGSSELSVLMRNMLHQSDSIKKIITEGGLPDKFPDTFLKIHTAQPTDSDTKRESFDGFATNYLNALKLVYNSPKDKIAENYNSLVNACLACHAEHCPGPVKVIKKLKIGY